MSITLAMNLTVVIFGGRIEPTSWFCQTADCKNHQTLLAENSNWHDNSLPYQGVGGFAKR